MGHVPWDKFSEEYGIWIMEHSSRTDHVIIWTPLFLGFTVSRSVFCSYMLHF